MLATLTLFALNIVGNPDQFDCHPAYGTQDKCLVFSAGYPDFLVTFNCDNNYPTWRDEMLVFFPDAGIVQQAGRNYLCKVVTAKQLSRPEAREMQR